MTAKRGKPKAVKAWAVATHAGRWAGCWIADTMAVYRTKADAWQDCDSEAGERIVRVLITPLEPSK